MKAPKWATRLYELLLKFISYKSIAAIVVTTLFAFIALIVKPGEVFLVSGFTIVSGMWALNIGLRYKTNLFLYSKEKE
jgi:hypothetical protein